MKLEFDLCKEILNRIEASPHAGLDDLTIDGYSAEQIDYHYGLLVQAGLVNAEPIINPVTNINWLVHGLTWNGHEFLNASKNIGIWEKAKSIVVDKVGSTTFDYLLQTMLSLGRQQLGL